MHLPHSHATVMDSFYTTSEKVKQEKNLKGQMSAFSRKLNKRYHAFEHWVNISFMEKTNTQTSSGAPYFRHEMYPCFLYRASGEEGRADPSSSSSSHPSAAPGALHLWLSQGSTTTAPSQRTFCPAQVPLCFPSLQTTQFC